MDHATTHWGKADSYKLKQTQIEKQKKQEAQQVRDNLLMVLKEVNPYLTHLGDLNLHAASNLPFRQGKGPKDRLGPDLIVPLHLMVNCESIYHDMSYLQHKRLREDAIKYMYTQVPPGLQKIIDAFRGLAHLNEHASDVRNAIIALTQVQHELVPCRLDLINLYQELANLAKGNMEFAALHTRIETFHGTYRDEMNHPWLAKLKFNVMLEIKILNSLCNTQAHLQRHRFKDTMLWLTICRAKLTEWVRRFDLSDPNATNASPLPIFRRSNRPIDHRKVIPQFTYWASTWVAALVAKASFYFHNLISELSVGAGHGAQSAAKLATLGSPNHLANLTSLVQRTEAHRCYIILDCTDRPSPLKGYQCHAPFATGAVAQGFASWPALLSIPSGPPDITHWPSIVSLLIDKKEILGPQGLTFCFNEIFEQPESEEEAMEPLKEKGKEKRGGKGEKKIKPVAKGPPPKRNMMFMVNRVESRVFLVVLYKEYASRPRKKKTSESALAAEINAIVREIRCIPVFADLRPKSK